MTREPPRLATMRDQIRVLLVDDHAPVRRGIRAFLEALGIEVIAEASDGSEALRLLVEMCDVNSLPDVVLMDLVMPGMDGVTATGRISRRYPGVRVIVLTGFAQTDRIDAALANGAESCLLKDAAPADVAHAILRP